MTIKALAAIGVLFFQYLSYAANAQCREDYEVYTLLKTDSSGSKKSMVYGYEHPQKR